MIHIIYISTLCVYLLPYFIIHGPVLVKDMQTLDLKRSRFHFLVQNDAQYSESNKKINFQTFPTIFYISFTNFKCFYRPKFKKKLSQKIRNALKRIFVFMSF